MIAEIYYGNREIKIMLTELSQQLEVISAFLQAQLHFILIIIGGLYVIQILNWILGYRLNILGIYPRKFFGLFGIVFSPFLHGSFNHLFFNSIPLIVLLSFVLLQGWTTLLLVSATIILLSGFATWLVGRQGFHVGASALIMGYWSYLLVNAYRHPTLLSIVLAIVCLYYFGGLLFNLFPQAEKSSWEGHIFGFLAGLAAAYINYSLITFG